jgi:hypothetical protein
LVYLKLNYFTIKSIPIITINLYLEVNYKNY